MKCFMGEHLSGGVAVGRIRYIGKKTYESDAAGANDVAGAACADGAGLRLDVAGAVGADLCLDAAGELERFETAREAVIADLGRMKAEARSMMDEAGQAILEGHELLMSDDGLINGCRDMIADQGCSAGQAVLRVFESKAYMLENSSDEYLSERGADLRDLMNSMLGALGKGQPEDAVVTAEHELDGMAEQKMDAMGEHAAIDTHAVETVGNRYVVAADDLLPSEVLRLDKKGLAGMIMKKGSPISHAAIISKGLGIPVLIRCEEVSPDWDGHLAVIREDSILLDPDKDELNEAIAEMTDSVRKPDAGIRGRIGRIRRAVDEIMSGADTPEPHGADKPSDVPIRIYANISLPSEADEAADSEAEGIGLFRTEFLYMGRGEAPGEEEQYEAYRHVLEKMDPRPVIIRTFDLGGDKSADYLMGISEDEAGQAFAGTDDPVAGCRGIRLALRHRDMFKTQLRALIRASRHGSLGIMFPMISDVSEIMECKRLIDECTSELRDDGELFTVQEPYPAGHGRHFMIGTMIETPAATLCADELAAECDFFSIGTNDLTQYVYAYDRQGTQPMPYERTGDAQPPEGTAGTRGALAHDAMGIDEGDSTGSDAHGLRALMKLIRMTADAAHAAGIPVGICGEIASDPGLASIFGEYGIDYLSV